MPRFFATATISTEFEVEASTQQEAIDHFRRSLGVDQDRPRVYLHVPDTNSGPVLLINPLTMIGLVGEVVGPLG